MRTSTTTELPIYIRFSFITFILFAVIYTIEIAQNILLPILFALLMGILLNPVVNYLERKGINRMLAIIGVILIVFALVFGLFFLVFGQIQQFSNSLPALESRIDDIQSDVIHWISGVLKMSEAETLELIMKTKSMGSSDFKLTENLFMVGQTLGLIFLFPIYLVLVLYYKSLLLRFVYNVVDSKKTLAVEKILIKTKHVIQSYLVGLFFELVIIILLFTTGLFLLGVKYAILLGIIGGLLNLIPYLGATIASLLFMLVALMTQSPISAVYVFLMSVFVQFLDNNIIVPRVVASRVQINALASIIVVIIGGSLLGVAGMFLSIPITAIIKVIFDNTPKLKPWGELLGTVEPAIKLPSVRRRKKNIPENMVKK